MSSLHFQGKPSSFGSVRCIEPLYQRNQREYEKVAEYIQMAVQGRKGNYLVFFPSYHT